MNYPLLSSGTLLRRYKRFLADILLDDGREVTAHCANTGAMTGLAQEGARVWLSFHNNAKRKLAWSWELVEIETTSGQALASVNTARTNGLVKEALLKGVILHRIVSCQPEVKVDDARLDFKVIDDLGHATWIEVKQVTLLQSNGVGAFPDAVSTRALRHVQALEARVAAGDSAILLFCATHTGIKTVRPAAEIHPAYAQAVKAAAEHGVQIKAYGCHIDTQTMRLTHALPVLL